MIKSGGVFASGNVYIVYVTSLLFYVIGRLCPSKRQNLKSCSVNKQPVTHCSRDKSIALLPYAVNVQQLFENLQLS